MRGGRAEAGCGSGHGDSLGTISRSVCIHTSLMLPTATAAAAAVWPQQVEKSAVSGPGLACSWRAGGSG